jgi:serine/threonine protein kinase
VLLRLNRYVSLKITLASQTKDVGKEAALYQSHLQPGSKYLVALYDAIKITGPNGQHDCLVYETMGPDLTALLRKRPEFQIGEPWERRFTKGFAKRALLDTIRALDFLHERGVVHGDVHLGNILTCIGQLNVSPSSESVLQQPASHARPLNRLDGKKDLWAPSYLLEPLPLDDHFSYDLDPVVKLADLGGCKSCSEKTARWGDNQANLSTLSIYRCAADRWD